jgi:hypothetical protein
LRLPGYSVTFTEFDCGSPDTVTYAWGVTSAVTKNPPGVLKVTLVLLPAATETVTDAVVVPWWMVTVAVPE